MLAEVAKLATEVVAEVTDALDAEQWASSLMGTWMHQPDADAVFFPGLVRSLEALRTAPALAALRALSAVGAPGRAELAGAAADRLAATGLPEPGWVGELGKARPTAAALVCEDDFDDGVSVVVEFSGSHTLGVYVDHNLGGLVKDVFVAGPLVEVRAEFERPRRAGDRAAHARSR
jgi:putative intracellular protease/amidase